MYEIIKTLKPYFFSLRDIQGKIGFGLKLPALWEYEKIITQYKDIKLKVQDSNDEYNLIELIATSSNDGYNDAINCTRVIIKVNKEEEEKQKLFQEKINELKQLFANESLDKLKDINLFGNNGQIEDSTGSGVAEQGNTEGQ